LWKKLKGISKPAAAVNTVISLEETNKWDKFKEWLVEHDVNFDKLYFPALFNEEGFEFVGVQATKKINESEEILCIPLIIIITHNIAYYSDLEPVFKIGQELLGKGHCMQY
jgi:hypothetical protein